MTIRTTILLAATLATGCMSMMGPASPAPAASGATVDDASILASIAGGAYRHGAQFAAVSGAPYPSAAAAQTDIDVFVTAADYAMYTRISPDQSGSGASLAPGATIVREVMDGSGVVSKLTLMVKGPPGYNPTVGDFWFGVTTPDGTPVVDNGVTQLGKLSACYGCHMPRATDGFLFGVPTADRATPGTTPPATGGGSTDGGSSDGGAPGDMGTHCHGHGCDGNEQ